MMNQITKQIVSLYKYYSIGATSSNPYLKTITSLVIATTIVLFDVLVILDKENWLTKSTLNSGRFIEFVEISIKLLPLFILYTIVFSRKKIDSLSLSNVEVSKRNKINLLLGIFIGTSLPILLIIKYGFGK